jgi:ADP-ribose pyrophosphatase YjhB (NUDIX family)
MGSRTHIRAAGGVLCRRAPDGEIEVAVIHRPRYEDWTLPKGKLNGGETLEQGALREVEEETGFRARLGPVAGEASYQDRHGRPKTVTYFYMTPFGGEFRPNDEVDEMRWLRIDDALGTLTHEHDRDLVTALRERPPPL